MESETWQSDQSGFAQSLGVNLPEVLRQRHLKSVTGLSPTTIWRLERRGEFPARAQLSPGAVGWFRDEVLARLAARRRGRRPAPEAANEARRSHTAEG